MQKQQNLVKNKKAFTLFETLISLTILAIVISLVYKLSFYNSYKKKFEKLENIQNLFILKNYSNDFSKKDETLKIIQNKTVKSINVKKILYNKDNISVYKYELQK
ncbi:prepilin-type N-terminal cleavage/methylation domain-containing protein [Malaciobacter marinus]|jgi:prepilin-type N-terminal cleavage/methylation domain-containing protein|uniref:Prepilin-type N-terminal cleavage/methylation domain-containing protein n=1 Tax=Malaciobacter marinus TaxID=505249 RepID=A0AB37A0G7_9BACT|nr:type II secretion system protein [Malaciobacter marinus]PPK62348.1 prepilin-type N-terminal cleavage/methylation domain-containing protein [Malaciobacter marinus]